MFGNLSRAVGGKKGKIHLAELGGSACSRGNMAEQFYAIVGSVYLYSGQKDHVFVYLFVCFVFCPVEMSVYAHRIEHREFGFPIMGNGVFLLYAC